MYAHLPAFCGFLSNKTQTLVVCCNMALQCACIPVGAAELYLLIQMMMAKHEEAHSLFRAKTSRCCATKLVAARLAG